MLQKVLDLPIDKGHTTANFAYDGIHSNTLISYL